jgi:hypothetical protein
MLILAFAVLLMVFHSINRRRLRVQYSLIWLGISAGMILVAAFPGIAMWLCTLTRIETPSNLIYLLGILTLLVIVFKQTEIISQHTEQIKRLTQEVSMEKHRAEEQGTHDET